MPRTDLLTQPGQLARFYEILADLFEKVRSNSTGNVPAQVNNLSRINNESFGIALCTVNGDRYSLGDSKVPFAIESLCKAFNYALVVNDIGSAEIHQYIGHEPVGNVSGFNELCLNANNKPHNPMTDSGGMMLVSLLKHELPVPERFDYIFNQYKKLAGADEMVGFSNSFYLQSKQTMLDGLLALGYFMQDAKVFPSGAKLLDTLDLYLQFCSVETTAESCAAMGATLANGGICPLTGQRVVSSEAVRNCLSLMHSCGMGDYSGQFAFKVGLPAKASVTGAIVVVIPSVLSICVWSPAVDNRKNSCRGVDFFERLVKSVGLHKFDHDPSAHAKTNLTADTAVVALLFSAAKGDLSTLQCYFLQDKNFLKQADYDGRTALHLGAAEGHLDICKFLIEKGGVDVQPKDRWGFTPIQEANRNNHTTVVDYLKNKGAILEPIPKHLLAPKRAPSPQPELPPPPSSLQIEDPGFELSSDTE